MFAQTFGSTTLGLNGITVTVEVDISNGIPGFDIVGLPDASVRESRERVRAAIKNSGIPFPGKRITVNLAPADLKKDSSGLDLPIAIAILAASGYIDPERCKGILLTAELSLEGKLRGISGVLPMAVNAAATGIPAMIVAPENKREALLAGDITVFAPEQLDQVIRHLQGEEMLAPEQPQEATALAPVFAEDYAEVQGQTVAKRAMEIVAAGGHNVLMIGPPGSGKTMIARRLTSILPAMNRQEALEVTKIYSVAGMLNSQGLIMDRPFRGPHHTVSNAGLIGGGRIPRPGEVTLSHNGVLFLDELPEFPRQVLEVLRQPLEDGEVTISRVNASLTYPARFMLVCSMNPCPCGYASDPTRECTCTPNEIRRYVKKISGPLLDRIDLHVHVPRLQYSEMSAVAPSESSATIRQRVIRAREIQSRRLSKYGIYCNAQMNHRHIKNLCPLTPGAQGLLRQAYTRMNLSARGYDRLIKVARTIADLVGIEAITEEHIAEAIHFRSSMQEM